MNPEMMIQRLAAIKAEGQAIMQQLEAAGIPAQQVMAAVDQMGGAPQGMPQGIPPGPPQGMPLGPPQEMPMPQGLLAP
jgi:hypothetical protein|tara:strand:- start:403 stop:636 length:234 start_codon:yes stop_codon:yes gene_type:complete